MKIKQFALLAVLAGIATVASATNIETTTKLWGVHDVTETGSNSIDVPYTGFNDFYDFSLTGQTTLSDYAFTVDVSNASNLSNSTLQLFQVGNSTALDTLHFDGLTPTHMNFGSHAAGNYYYEVTGDLLSPATNGSYTFVSNALVSPVPEPGSAALLMAGLGLMGFMARRRKS